MSNHENRATARALQARRDLLNPLIEQGFSVIPLHAPTATRKVLRAGVAVLDKTGKPLVRQIGKAPRDRDWTTKKYDPATVIRQCIASGWNIGARIPEGWLVIDIDPRNGGDEGFRNLCADFGLDPDTWKGQRTGSGGRHFFLRIPKGRKISATLRHDDDPEESDEFSPPRYAGVEFKVRGTQVVAPGSIHPNGNPYEWDSFGDVPDLADASKVPADLLEAITRPEREESAGGGHVSNARLAASLEGLNPENFREHEDWLQMMMACHHATGGEGRAEFIDWSTQDPDYADAGDDIGRRWDSLHADRDDGVSVASLNRHLVKAGRKDLLLQVETAAEAFGDDGIKFLPETPKTGDDDTSDDDDGEDDDDGGGLSVISAADIDPKPIQWAWRKRIPVGKLTIIAGFPEAGKSQVTTNLAAIISNGAAWPNDEGNAKQGAVFILSSEDDPDDTIVPRLKAAGAKMESVFVVNSIVRTKGKGARVFNLADDLTRLSDAIKAQRERGEIVRLVIIDPISAYVGSGNKRDSHKNTEMRALLTPLKEWASKHKVAVVAISHFNKGGNSHAVYRVTDSLAFTAAARMVWFCVILEDGRRVMIRGKGNISEDIGGLAYTIEGETVKDSKGRKISTSRIVWGDAVDVSAEDALSPRKKDRGPSVVDEVADWLEGFLQDGPQPSKSVKAAAADNGYSKYALDEAKTALGILPKREGFRGDYLWRLPADTADELTEFG